MTRVLVAGSGVAAVECLLLTGADPLYVRAELCVSATITTEPLWSPPAKIVGRYITPFLAADRSFAERSCATSAHGLRCGHVRTSEGPSALA